MIEFPCHCGNPLSVPQEMAGGSIQCPQCGRLADVPPLNELSSIDEGGMYKLDDAPRIQDSPTRIARLTEVFTRSHYDENGAPIDLRGPVHRDGVESSGPVPVETIAAGEKSPPKYDPTTGELIDEIDIKPPIAPPPAPIVNARLAYAPRNLVDGIDLPTTIDFFSIPALLLRPPNLMVMFFVYLLHLFGQMSGVVIAFGFFLAVPVWMICHALLLAHFGNVIDETGPQCKAELPAPLRNLSWSEDFWSPFCQTVVASSICFGPALVLVSAPGSLPVEVSLALGGLLLLVGFISFPAALMTATTSGSWPNLRPDRLLGVMRVAGGQYWAAVLVGMIATSAWVAGFLGVSIVSIASMTVSITLPPFVRWYTTHFVLILGVYLMHLFCWQLGMLYRKHHMDFPWILQRHGGRPIGAPTGFPVGKSKPKAAAAVPVPMRVEPIDLPPPQA